MNRVANYEYCEKIGHGAFGVVYKGRNIRSGESVVIKMEPLIKDQIFSYLKHESSILNLLYSKSRGGTPDILVWNNFQPRPTHFSYAVLHRISCFVWSWKWRQIDMLSHYVFCNINT